MKNEDCYKLIALIIQTFGVIGGFIAIYFQLDTRNKQEKSNFETQLIVNAVEINNLDITKRNITFLIETGLVSIENVRIVSLLKDTLIKKQFKSNKDTTPNEAFALLQPNNDIIIIKSKITDIHNKPIKDVNVVVNPTYQIDGKIIGYFNATKSDSLGFFAINRPKNSSYSLLIFKNKFQTIHKKYPRYTLFNNTIVLEPEKPDDSFFPIIKSKFHF